MSTAVKNVEWATRPLIEVATLKRGYDLPVQDRTDGVHPIFAANGPVGFHGSPKCKGPGVVTGRSGTIGKVHFVESDYWPLNTSLYVMDFHGNFPKWVYYMLQSFGLERYSQGAGVPTLNRNLVHHEMVKVPSAEEQRRIAAILDQTETLRTQRRAALALVDSLTQSLFLDMFGERVVNPKGLPICELQRLCTRITDGTHQSPVWQTSGIPFLFISNIIEGQINFDTHKFISAETHAELTKRCPIETGDVLYTTVGSYGNAAVVSTEKLFAFQRHIAHIKPDRNKLDSRFLAAMIQSPGVRQQVDKVAKGIAQKTVNLADLKGLSVFVPPLPLQQIFATRIQAIETLKTTHRRALASLEALFASLQQRAFSGELSSTAPRTSAQSVEQLQQLEASIGQEALIYIAKRMPDGDLYNSLKAVYFADRHHLEHYGHQIYNETYSALRHGPVPQAAYDATQVLIGELMLSSFDDEAMRAALRRKGKTLTALRDADFSKLSPAIVESLEWAIRYCRDMKFGQTKAASHDSAYERTPKKEAIPLRYIINTLPPEARERHWNL